VNTALVGAPSWALSTLITYEAVFHSAFGVQDPGMMGLMFGV
jgi:hypothetical protein